jgi:hypothetical protein
MSIHSLLHPEAQNKNMQYIDLRWKQLYALQKEWGEKAINLLIFLNSGGAVAMLGFIGTQKSPVWLGSKVALGAFSGGIVCVCIVTAISYHHMEFLFDTWRKGVQEYLQDKIAWEKLLQDDEKRANKRADVVFAYLSLLCFIVGATFGIIDLFLK